MEALRSRKFGPGKYSLTAFTDGVLGEFVKADIVVEKGKTLDLGKLEWVPVRKGRQLWDVGIPNRNGNEFAGANKRRDPAISIKYAELFPNDVNYVIGKSDYSKDWFFQQVPHNTDPDREAGTIQWCEGNRQSHSIYDSIRSCIGTKRKGNPSFCYLRNGNKFR